MIKIGSVAIVVIVNYLQLKRKKKEQIKLQSEHSLKKYKYITW